MPGERFFQYTATVYSATRTALDGVLLEAESVIFRWADPGDNRVVSVEFTLDNAPNKCNVTATFNVKDLVVTYPINPPPFGQVNFNSALPPTDVLLRDASSSPPLTQGFYPNAQVSLPSGFSTPGKWAFWQLIHSTDLIRPVSPDDPALPCQYLTTAPDYYMDSNDANVTYTTGLSPAFAPGVTDGWATGVTGTVSDTPGWDDLTNTKLVSREIYYLTYVMFKPADLALTGGSSAWVALSRIAWQVVFCAEDDTLVGWYLTPTNANDRQSLGTWDDSNRMPPEWPGWYQNPLFVPSNVDCPPNCG